MKITDMSNLFVGYNQREDFKLCIVASDTQEALKMAEDYRKDVGMSGLFEITEFEYINTNFDCDYVLTAGNSSNLEGIKGVW